MADKTGISYCDATWPITPGCKEVSPGCANCWAARLAATRLKNQPKYKGLAVIGANGHPRFTGETRLWIPHLHWPLAWREPKTIFAASSGDLFHEDLSNDEIAAVFGVMAACERHTFLVLTKRPERARKWFAWVDGDARGMVPPASFVVRTEAVNRGIDIDQLANDHWPLPNVRIGVSVEDRKHGLPRIDVLREIPAACRWLSIEPQLEDLGTIDLRGIGWVVVGGESGTGARPVHPDWVRSIRDQCVAAGVKFHFKQWGAWVPVVPQYPDEGDVDEHGCERDVGYELSKFDGCEKACIEPSGCIPHREFSDGSFRCDHQPRPGAWWLACVGKKRAGRLLDGREWNEFPGVVRS